MFFIWVIYLAIYTVVDICNPNFENFWSKNATHWASAWSTKTMSVTWCTLHFGNQAWFLPNIHTDFLRRYHHGPESWGIFSKWNYCYLALLHLASLGLLWLTGTKQANRPNRTAADAVDLLCMQAKYWFWHPELEGVQITGSQATPQQFSSSPKRHMNSNKAPTIPVPGRSRSASQNGPQ